MRTLFILILIGCASYAVGYLAIIVYVIVEALRKPPKRIQKKQNLQNHNLEEAKKKYTAAKERYDSISHLAETNKAQTDHSMADIEISNMLHDARLALDEAQRGLEEAERCVNQGMHNADEARLAATGIEFGGNNPDLNLNPTMHHMVDEMNENSMTWNDSFQNACFDDPFPDYGWDNSSNFDAGFGSFDSGFDSFNGF